MEADALLHANTVSIHNQSCSGLLFVQFSLINVSKCCLWTVTHVANLIHQAAKDSCLMRPVRCLPGLIALINMSVSDNKEQLWKNSSVTEMTY